MSPSTKKKYVFLITVDALRADHVGCIGGGNLTPNLDKVAEESLLFTRAFANGPGTNQSFPAIMSSTYFLMNDGFSLNPRFKTLAQVLQENGFKTAAFHSNPFLSKTFGWDRGFDEFYDFMEELKSPSAFVTRKVGDGISNRLIRSVATHLGGDQNTRMMHLIKKVYYRFSDFEIPYLEGEKLNKQVFNWIENNPDKPFFLWMHYMDPHYPYVPPEVFCDAFSTRREAFEFNTCVDLNNVSKEELDTLKTLYRGEVRYTDFCIGELSKFLETKGLAEDSVIVIAADHGEAFMEHGRLGHKPDILYNEVLHVPLLIHGLERFSKLDFQVQLLDIPSTILDILRIKIPITFLGNKLLSIHNNDGLCRNIFSESAEPDLINLTYNFNKYVVSYIKDEWKLIINNLSDTIELYNLKKDFMELNNVILNEPSVSKRMKKNIMKHLNTTLRI